MTKRQRRILGAWFLCGASLLACAALALALAPKEREGPKDGLVLGVTDRLDAALPPDAPRIPFTAVPLDFRHFPGTRTHRLPEDMGSGAAIEDLDGDGDLDLVLCNCAPMGEPEPRPELFRNDGRGNFEKVDAGLPPLFGMGVAVGDYDGDDDPDLYFAGFGGGRLVRNEGGLRFRDVTEEAGVRGSGFCTAATFGDADGDGDLDLYVCRYVTFEDAAPQGGATRGGHSLPPTLNPSVYPAEPNLLFLNGNGRFREAAKEMGVDNPGGKSLGAVFADFSGDGVLDLYVANDVSDNAMFLGRPGQPYLDQTHASCTADWRGAMGLAVADSDGDGDLDIFVTHWISEENTLYVKEDGEFLFRDVAEETGLGPPSRPLVGWACDFADFDCDGRPDLAVVNGSTFEEPDSPTQLIRQPLQLFWSRGARFHDVAPLAGPALGTPVAGRGGVTGDIDGDGDPDWLVMVHGGAPLLLRNDLEKKGGAILVDVRGSSPNTFAFGALVTVEIAGRKQAQQVGTKIGYLSSGPAVLHFGLGSAAAADRVTVRFPSGRVVERQNVAAGARLVVKEYDARTLGPKIDAAADALVAGKRKEAEALYREIVRLDPEHANALYHLALLAEPAEAIVLCERVLRIEPMLPRGHLLRAAILSDPKRPEAMDLDTALVEVRNAQRLNRDETGGRFEEGRILLLKGEAEKAAILLETVAQNPRAAALAALCHLRAGRPDDAARLLGRRPGKLPEKVSEEGDTAHRRADDRDLLNRLLDFGENERFTLRRVESLPGEVARLPRAPSASFDEAAAFALAPPESCDGPPPGTTAVCEADLDGDGDMDLVCACGADDPCAALPWWALLREGERYRPVRGSLPEPGWRAAAVGAKDLDGDGRAEILLRGGGWLARDRAVDCVASLR